MSAPEQIDQSAASDEERSDRYHEQSDATSSSEDEEGLASPLPNKRQRVGKSYKNIERDHKIDSLITQVGYITSYLSQYNTASAGPSSQPIPIPSPSPYLTNPCSDSNKLQLGELSTNFDERKVIPPSDEKRLEKVNHLQHFDSQAWKGMRYKATLQGFSANPGFVALKVNEELCHFNKSKDYLAAADNIWAGLTNAELERQDLLKQGLQDLLNWAARNPAELNPMSLFEKVSSLLGTDSPLHNCSEKIMQIICGRRAECIEIRRDRILKEINNPMLKATMKDIPPSAEYLFSRNALQPVIQSLGGTQVWLNKPEYLKEKKPNHSRPSSNFRQDRQDKKPYSRTHINSRGGRSETRGRQKGYQGQQKHNFRGETKRNNQDSKQS